MGNKCELAHITLNVMAITEHDREKIVGHILLGARA